MNNAITKKLEVLADPASLSLTKTEATLTEIEQIERIQFHFSRIMETLGLDLSDDSLKDTPLRVAQMYVTEIFQGLRPESFPKLSVFSNTYGYKEMLVERDIAVYSCCEHHFLPFVGKAHVAYFPGENVIGLSKLNRIVKHFSRKPQVQERLTIEIAESLKNHLGTDDIAVHIEARHFCVAARGVGDTDSMTVTSSFSGRFHEPHHKQDFYRTIQQQR